MKAVVLRAIGELSYEDVPDAQIERPDDVLVRIRAVGICGADIHGYLGHTGRRIPPMIMGHEAAGEVIAVGNAVTKFRPGDRVALLPMQICGECVNCRAGKSHICLNRQLLGSGRTMKGALAERIAWPEKSVFPMPDHLSFEEAALAEPTAVSAHAISLAQIAPGSSLLVVGAGTIGLLALACALVKSPGKVYVSDTSDSRLANARDWGAGATLNPLRDDVVQIIRDETDGLGVDRAIEAVGNTPATMQTIRATRSGGLVVWIGNNQKIIETDMQEIVTRELTVQGSFSLSDRDFVDAIELVASRKVPAGKLIGMRGSLQDGPAMFAELANNLNILKAVILVD